MKTVTITLSQSIEGYLLDAAARRLSDDTIHGYTYVFRNLDFPVWAFFRPKHRISNKTQFVV